MNGKIDGGEVSDTGKGRACHKCSSTAEELRPYGPGGKLVCFPCIKADPDLHATAVKVYQRSLLQAGKVTGFVEIGTEAGPKSIPPPDLGESR